MSTISSFSFRVLDRHSSLFPTPDHPCVCFRVSLATSFQSIPVPHLRYLGSARRHLSLHSFRMFLSISPVFHLEIPSARDRPGICFPTRRQPFSILIRSSSLISKPARLSFDPPHIFTQHRRHVVSSHQYRLPRLGWFVLDDHSHYPARHSHP